MSATTEQFSDALKSGRTRAELIHEMKLRGLTIIEAIKASRELFGVSLGEAKLLVSTHPDWQQVAAAAAPLHHEIVQAFADPVADGEATSDRDANAKD